MDLKRSLYLLSGQSDELGTLHMHYFKLGYDLCLTELENLQSTDILELIISLRSNGVKNEKKCKHKSSRLISIAWDQDHHGAVDPWAQSCLSSSHLSTVSLRHYGVNRMFQELQKEQKSKRRRRSGVCWCCSASSASQHGLGVLRCERGRHHTHSLVDTREEES